MADLPGAKIALVAGAGEPLSGLWRSRLRICQAPAPKKCTLLIGAERDGLPDEVVAQADHVAHIPIATHSLNAAMAATVALYELDP